MNSHFLVNLGNNQHHGYVVGSRLPESDPAYSPLLDIGFSRQDHPWLDEVPHLHTHSEECFIVVQGRLDLLVGEQLTSVEAGELAGIRVGVPHQITGGRAPIASFLIRVPGGGEDKVLLESKGFTSHGPAFKPLRVDLRQSYQSYPLGACLPQSHPNYSPLLDFTCVCAVKPAEEWRTDQRHYHTLCEEYYIVLRGRLDLEVNGSVISVGAGQILGIRVGAIHQVVGGQGPVDVFFIRVPGGRGDKRIVEIK